MLQIYSSINIVLNFGIEKLDPGLKCAEYIRIT